MGPMCACFSIEFVFLFYGRPIIFIFGHLMSFIIKMDFNAPPRPRFGDNEICMVLIGTMMSTHVSMRMRPPSMSRMAHALRSIL